MASNRTSNLIKGTNLFKVIVNVKYNNQMNIRMSHFFSWGLPRTDGFSNFVSVTLRDGGEAPAVIRMTSAACWTGP